MSGPSIDISQFRALAAEIGIGVVADAYAETPITYPSWCEVLPPESASTPLYGDISTTLHFGTTPWPTEDSQAWKRTTGGEGYRPQVKITPFKTSISIPKRMFNSLQGRGEAARLIEDFSRQFGRSAAIQKESFVMSLLQRGGITAGDTTYFDNSYVGRPDPNAGKIYDGVSFFNSAHPIKYGSATFDNADALTLTAANLDASYTKAAYTNAFDESGRQISTPPDILIVPTALRSTGQTLLGSDQLPGTGNNDINTNRGLLRLIVSPFITTATAWAVGASRTIRVFDSGAPELVTWEDNDNDDFVYGLKYLFGAAPREWRGWVGNNFPTS